MVPNSGYELIIHDSNPTSLDVWLIISCALLIIYFVITTVYGIKYEIKLEETKKKHELNRKTEKKDSLKEEKHIRNGILKLRISYVVRVLIPVFAVMFTLNYVIAVATVETGSMEPKLVVGNMEVYNRWSYKNAEPERGDIILFYSDEFNVNMAKRIIGIPGDHIQFENGYVYINGKRAEESEYIKDGIKTLCPKEFDVPEDTVFVLGDFREYSYDSRYFEQPYIPYGSIIGKYMGQSRINPKYWLEQRGVPMPGKK